MSFKYNFRGFPLLCLAYLSFLVGATSIYFVANGEKNGLTTHEAIKDNIDSTPYATDSLGVFNGSEPDNFSPLLEL